MNKNNMISPLLSLLVFLIFIYSFLLIILDRKKNQINKKDVHELLQETREIYEKALEEGDDDVKWEYVKEHRKDLPISTYHLCKEFNVPKRNVSDSTEGRAIKKNSSNDYTYGDIHRSVVSPTKFVKTAVIDVSFGVRNHECFDLLGPNGAGKSTTFEYDYGFHSSNNG